LVLSLLVSVGFIYWSLRGKDLGQIWIQLKTANYWYLVPYGAILLVIHVLRTVRWGMLIAPLEKMPFRRLNAVSAVGFMALIVLPFRLGEFARPYLIRVPGKVSASAAMASIVVERVLDGLMVAALLVVLLLRVPIGGPNIERVRWGGYAMFGFFFGLLLFLIVAYLARDFALRFVRATAGKVSAKLADKLCYLLESFVNGLRALPSAREIAVIALLTAAYWGINGFGMLVLALAFDIHLSLLQAYTCLGVLVIGVMLPAGPGMVGTFQAFTQLGLSLFMAQADSARGAAYSNVLWAGQFVQQVSLGLIFLNSRHLSADHHRVSLGELMNADKEVEGEEAQDSKDAEAAKKDDPKDPKGSLRQKLSQG
jgi:glycosyltransferase 2 family protein